MNTRCYCCPLGCLCFEHADKPQNARVCARHAALHPGNTSTWRCPACGHDRKNLLGDCSNLACRARQNDLRREWLDQTPQEREWNERARWADLEKDEPNGPTRMFPATPAPETRRVLGAGRARAERPRSHGARSRRRVARRYDLFIDALARQTEARALLTAVSENWEEVAGDMRSRGYYEPDAEGDE